MGPGLFVIAILGCGDGSAQCQSVATLPTRYESQSSCAAATSSALIASTRFDFPELQAECRSLAAPRASQRPDPARQTRG
ncbi:MAG: hypothetical protein ABIR77_01215 [Sphingomicrobium sp.]